MSRMLAGSVKPERFAGAMSRMLAGNVKSVDNGAGSYFLMDFRFLMISFVAICSPSNITSLLAVAISGILLVEISYISVMRLPSARL